MRAFGRPEGVLGWIGGRLMARGKTECGTWLVNALAPPQDTRILEIGCGPGVVLALLGQAAPSGHAVGVDPSPTMLSQARRRNAAAIAEGRIELLLGEAEALPLADAGFDIAVTLNSAQLWRDVGAGLRECRRVLRPRGKLWLGFTPEAGQSPGRLDGLLHEAGFGDIKTIDGSGAVWTVAVVPQ